MAQELNLGREPYRDIFYQVGVGIAQIDLSGHFLLINQRLADLLGYSIEELRQETVLDLIHPSDRNTTQAYLQQVIAGDEPEGSIESRCRSNGEGFVWVHITLSPLLGVSGQTESLIAVLRDISERKQAEAALQASEYRYYTLTRSLPVGVCRTDGDGLCVYLNDQWCELTGYAMTQFIGEHWTEIAHPEDRAQVRENWQRAVHGHHPFQAEFRVQTLTGGIRWVFGQVAAERGVEQEVAGYVGTITDFTDRRLAEAAIRDSEERFRQLADNIHQVFWMTSSDRTEILYVSSAFELVWGYSCQDLYAKPNLWLEAIHPEDRERAIAAHQRSLQGEQSACEYRLGQKEESIRWIWERAFPIRNEAGTIYRIAGIAEDITERKQAELEIQRALVKEKELSNLKSRFVTMASHELRTPLSVILSSVDMLEYYLQPASAESKQQVHLRRIQDAVQTVTHLLNDVLTIGQGGGALECNPSALDLTVFCRQLIEECLLVDNHQHQVHLVVSGIRGSKASNTSPVVYLDKQLLRQIVNNLLSNALKYSPMDRPVELAIIFRKAELTLEIRDQGIGIPKEDQDRLFEPFHRGGNVGVVSGTGLGLAIVQQAAARHGGHIQIRSREGQGTTASVTLPLNRPLL